MSDTRATPVTTGSGHRRLSVRLPPGPAIAALRAPARPLLPPPAVEVWPREGLLWAWGTWHPDEVRTARCARATLVAVGQCLADSPTMHRDLRRAASDGHWERLTHWPGSYLLIVGHDDGLLTTYTDPAGQFPLYYAQHGDRTALSTRATAAAILAGTDGAPDTTVLAAHIVCPAVPELTAARTAFAGVRRLGGGEALRLDPSGTLTRWTYEPLSADDGTSFEDGAAHLRAALTRAVDLRTARSGRITADLSGGKDSTSLAFLAARTAPGPLESFVYHHPRLPAGDLEHALRYAAPTPSLHLRVTEGDETSLPYADLHLAEPTDQPDPAAVIGARLRLRLAHIARGGDGTHLTGEGGDAVLAAPPSYLGDLAAAGGLPHLVRHARALARMRHLSPARVTLRALRLAHTPAPRAWHDLAGALHEPADRPPQWLDAVAWWPAPGPEAAWLTPRMRHRLAELARQRARTADPEPASRTPGTRAALHEVRTSAAVQAHLTSLARPFGIWPQAPYLDGDVVRACMNLPLPRKADPFTAKPLLVAALSGLVPDPVLRRRTKGDYMAENYHGARRHAAHLRARLARSPLGDLGVIEPSRVLATLDRALAGLPTPFPALDRLLSADMWLTSHDNGQELP
ncbi:albusnodin/ikarugamycin family macrolactam cyclase [Streptomyces prasinus]|uniref:albusnodin/ikarugamycin family macrolactam cyclase n=1 Tax=Streptomyces prasinus TaxID=67345 RepID=UPI0036384429